MFIGFADNATNNEQLLVIGNAQNDDTIVVNKQNTL